MDTRRWKLVGLIAVVIVAGLLAWVFNTHDGPRPVQNETSSGLQTLTQPPPSANERDYQLAVSTRTNHSQHYQCQEEYPPDAELRLSDLIPTANVVVIIRYSSDLDQYAVDSDPRVNITRDDTIQPANSDMPQPFRWTQFSWTYDEGVEHFATYLVGNNAHGQMRSHEDEAMERHYVGVSPDVVSARGSKYVIIATDTTTCDPAPNPLPQEFSWEQLAAQGISVPMP